MTANPYRRHSQRWKEWEAEHVEPLSDEAMTELRSYVIDSLGHEHISYDGCCDFDDSLARKILGLMQRVQDIEPRVMRS